jgi:hypothetical protein
LQWKGKIRIICAKYKRNIIEIKNIHIQIRKKINTIKIIINSTDYQRIEENDEKLKKFNEKFKFKEKLVKKK